MGFSPKGVQFMPKLNNRPPKYSKMGKYAVVYFNGKPHYLGLYGSPESHTAYARIIAEIRANPSVPLPSEEKRATVRELAAAFLDNAKANTKQCASPVQDPSRTGEAETQKVNPQYKEKTYMIDYTGCLPFPSSGNSRKFFFGKGIERI